MKKLLTAFLATLSLVLFAQPPLLRGPGTTNTPPDWTNVVKSIATSAIPVDILTNNRPSAANLSITGYANKAGTQSITAASFLGVGNDGQTFTVTGLTPDLFGTAGQSNLYRNNGSLLTNLISASVKGKPYVTVSPDGIANSRAVLVNNGADFGPDTAGTTTSGLQEAIGSFPKATGAFGLDLGATNAGGGALFCLPGNFEISSLINFSNGLPFNLEIFGSPDVRTTWTYTGSPTNGFLDAHGNVTGSLNLHIHHLAWVYPFTNVSIINDRTNYGYVYLMRFSGNDVEVDHMTFYGGGSFTNYNGLGLGGAAGGNNVPSALIAIEDNVGGANRVSIHDNLFSGLAWGIFANSDHHRIIDNIFCGCGTYLRSNWMQGTAITNGQLPFSYRYGGCILETDGGDSIVEKNHFFTSSCGGYSRCNDTYANSHWGENLYESMINGIMIDGASASITTENEQWGNTTNHYAFFTNTASSIGYLPYIPISSGLHAFEVNQITFDQTGSILFADSGTNVVTSDGHTSVVSALPIDAGLAHKLTLKTNVDAFDAVAKNINTNLWYTNGPNNAMLMLLFEFNINSAIGTLSNDLELSVDTSDRSTYTNTLWNYTWSIPLATADSSDIVRFGPNQAGVFRVPASIPLSPNEKWRYRQGDPIGVSGGSLYPEAISHNTNFINVLMQRLVQMK